MAFAPKQKIALPVASHKPKPVFGSSRSSLLSQNARTLADFFTPFIQPKLTVNAPGDKYEQEADRVAEAVICSNAGLSRVPSPTGVQTVGGNNGHTFSKTAVAFPTPCLGHDFGKISVFAPRPRIQTKLTVNEPGDKYEQEADRVAEEVMRSSSLFGGGISAGGPPNVQKKCAACESGGGLCPQCAEEEEKKLQRKPISSAITPLAQRENAGTEEEKSIQTKGFSGRVSQLTSNLTGRIQTLLGRSGQPLPKSERAFFEPRFGHDFSKVRIFPDAQAAHLAREVNARAFTLGPNIVFGRGEYAPETDTGRRLMAHELTHVVQQGDRRPLNDNIIMRVDVRPRPCTPREQTMLDNHLQHARNWVQNTNSRLQGYRNAMNEEPDPRLNRILRRALRVNFHVDINDPSHQNHIQHILDKFGILDIAIGGSQSYQCDTSRDQPELFAIASQTDEDQTSQGALLNLGFGGRILIRPGWFRCRDFFSRVTTLIHERAHVVLNFAPDYAYECQSAYRNLSIENAINNAESYAVAARQIYHNGDHWPCTHNWLTCSELGDFLPSSTTEVPA